MQHLLGLLFGILLISFFAACEKIAPKELPPDIPVYIPDNEFLQELIDDAIDINGDGIISPVEAEGETYLDVSEDSISNMTGIEEFIILDTLLCNKIN